MQKTPRHVKRAANRSLVTVQGAAFSSGELSFEIPADAGGGYQWGILSSDKTIRQSGGGPGGGGPSVDFPFLNPGQGNPGDKRGRGPEI